MTLKNIFFSFNASFILRSIYVVLRSYFIFTKQPTYFVSSEKQPLRPLQKYVPIRWMKSKVLQTTQIKFQLYQISK